MKPWTHDTLIARGERWLRNSAWVYSEDKINGRRYKSRTRCAVVLTEPPATREQPDVIGWCHGGQKSLLIECKVSRADFFADRSKWHRTKSGKRFGLGKYRYYLTPESLIDISDLPDGWGLLEASGRQIKVVRQSAVHERDVLREMNLLWSECRKIQFIECGGTIDTKAGRRIAASLPEQGGF